MKELKYTITDEVGIHARPAGLLVQEVKKYDSDIKMSFNGKTVPAKSLMSVMSLGVKCGNEITMTAEGADEDNAIAGLEKFLAENL